MGMLKFSGISTDAVLFALELILSEEDKDKISIEDLSLGKRKVFMNKAVSIPHTKEYIERLKEKLDGGILLGEGNKRYLQYIAFYRPISLEYALKDFNGLVDLDPKKGIKATTLIRYLNDNNQRGKWLKNY